MLAQAAGFLLALSLPWQGSPYGSVTAQGFCRPGPAGRWAWGRNGRFSEQHVPGPRGRKLRCDLEQAPGPLLISSSSCTWVSGKIGGGNSWVVWWSTRDLPLTSGLCLLRSLRGAEQRQVWWEKGGHVLSFLIYKCFTTHGLLWPLRLPSHLSGEGCPLKCLADPLAGEVLGTEQGSESMRAWNGWMGTDCTGIVLA